MAVSAKRNARIEVTAETAKMDRGLADAKRKLRTFEREQARAARAAAREAERRAKAAEKARAKAMRSIGGGVAQGFGQAVGLEGIESLRDTAKDVFDYERTLVRLQLTASTSSRAVRQLSNSIQETSNATGLGRSDILEAVSTFVAMGGSLGDAAAQMETWAKTAQATGTNIQDIVKVAQTLNKQLAIGPEEMTDAFAALAAQAKQGNIELNDLASRAAVVMPMWQTFGDQRNVDGVRRLGAALQVVKGAFAGDAGETVNGLQSLLVALQKNADRFADYNIKIFEKDKNGVKRARDLFDIIDSIGESKLVKDPQALINAFGRVEAYRAYLQLRNNRKELEALIDVAKDGTVIQRDFDTYMASSAGRMEASWNRMKNAIAAALTPERIEQFADAIESLAEKIDPIAKMFGFAADVLGGLHGIGKKARGVFNAAMGNENGNPFSDLMVIDDRGRTMRASDIVNAAPGSAIASNAELVERARRRIENRKGYDRTVRDILAGEINERTSPESIRRAVIARFSANEGAATAGNRYLANVFDSGDKVSAEVDRVLQKIAADLGRAAANDARNLTNAVISALERMTIKIGSEPIQKAGANSIQHRRGQH